MPPEDLYDAYKTPLAAMGFNTAHDKRALVTSFKFVSFIALKSAHEYFKDDRRQRRHIEELSKKLHMSRISIMDVADELNDMYK